MNRRRFLATSSLAVAAAALPWPALGHPADDAFTMLRRGVGTFTGRGGTIGWLIRPETLVVVDAQFPDTAATCRQGLHERAGRNVDVLVNTHHHGDHTAGNPVFAGEARMVLAHQAVPALQRRAAARNDQAGPQAFATATYTDAFRYDLGDETLALRHYGPAHTGGDSVAHFEQADVAHLGDLVFNRMPCYIDLAGGADTEGWIAALEQIHADFSDDTRFIYGHGNPAFGITGTRADLLVMRDFLTALREHVAQARAAGHSEDEVAATDRLAAFPDHYSESWPTGISNALRAVYQEMAG